MYVHMSDMTTSYSELGFVGFRLRPRFVCVVYFLTMSSLLSQIIFLCMCVVYFSCYGLVVSTNSVNCTK